MNLALVMQYLFSGITVGSIYAVVAIGYNIIYNATGIINFAQGEFVMLGGMIAFSLSRVMPMLPAVMLAVAITAALGSGIEVVFIRKIRRSGVLQMIIVTIGLSILLREAALHVWDEQVRSLAFFTGNEVSSLRILGARVSPQVLWVLGVTAIAVTALFLFFSLTLTGKAMRACASNRRAAGLCGINTRRMVNLSFALSAGLGALAGCVVSPLTQTHYGMGSELAIKGFTVAILGGLGNSGAALVAGILLGVIEAFSISIFPMAYKDAIAVLILIIVLVAKPSGLFGSREAAALKEY
jgi:branched-chain amino acid transport system permease protein